MKISLEKTWLNCRLRKWAAAHGKNLVLLFTNSKSENPLILKNKN